MAFLTDSFVKFMESVKAYGSFAYLCKQAIKLLGNEEIFVENLENGRPPRPGFRQEKGEEDCARCSRCRAFGVGICLLYGTGNIVGSGT